MKNLTCILLFLITLNSCDTFKAISLLKSGKVDEKNYLVEIPVEIEQGEIVLLVTINGKPYRFIFDSGAITILNQSLADSLGVKTKARITAADSEGNENTIELARLGSVSIGNLEFTKQSTAIFNFDEHKEIACFKIDGIIGANLMRNSIWEIDMLKKKLKITNNIQNLSIKNAEIILPFKPSIGGTPKIELMIDGLVFNDVTFDYGSNSGLDIISPTIKSDTFKLTNKKQRSFGNTSVGLYGGNYDTIITFIADTIHVGNGSFTDHITTLKKTGLSTLGTTILDDYIVTIDWFEKLIYMKKQDSLPETNDNILETFGVFASLKNEKLIVNHIYENSPADRAGIMLDDEIISIDGVEFSTLTDDEYCEIINNGLFPDDKNETSVIFKRNKISKEVILRKKKLL